MIGIKDQVEKDGYAFVAGCVSEETVVALLKATDTRQCGVRNLLANPTMRALAASEEVRRPVESVLGRECFAVRGILFNKRPQANWKVTWHQDCVIAVRERVEIEGWGPWSRKGGVRHVRPTASIVERMVAIRIHLDDCGEENGPLRVLPSTHKLGFLSDEQIQQWPKEPAVICAVKKADAILMRPLLLHASTAARQPFNRRVIHLEFAAHELPHGAQWYDRVS